MWIERENNAYTAYLDGKVAAKTLDPISALHALWVLSGSPKEYTLYLDDDESTVHKKYVELPKGI